MKEVVIYEHQLKEIIDALRLTSRINKCSKKETCFDRTVMRAKKYAENALEGKIDDRVNYV